jgi:hypothetical protein
MKVTIKKHEDDHYIDIEEFKDIIDISKVKYYELESLDSGAFAIIFYDEDKNVIKPIVDETL